MYSFSNKLKTSILRIYSEFVVIVTTTLVKMSPILASKFIYKVTTGKKLDLVNPVDFNEKIQWLKLYWNHPLVIKCSDKYTVREYVTDCGCKEILNELYYVYSDADSIIMDNLPSKFVLKTTNSCATNIICTNKDQFNISQAKAQLRKWLKQDNGLKYAEIQYSKMQGRIICEKFLESETGFFPIDYKVFCFNGVPRFIYVGVEREKGLKRVYYDTNWNQINMLKEQYKFNVSIEKPKKLAEMIDYAKKLSKPFPFVRVDFYIIEDKVIFGEMTFTPTGGLATYYTDESLLMIGDMISLPNKLN